MTTHDLHPYLKAWLNTLDAAAENGYYPRFDYDHEAGRLQIDGIWFCGELLAQMHDSSEVVRLELWERHFAATFLHSRHSGAYVNPPNGEFKTIEGNPSKMAA